MVAAVLAVVALIPAGFHETKVLEPAASFVAGKPSTIVCANTNSYWKAYVEQRFNGQDGTVASGMPAALTDVGGSVSYFSPIYCIVLVQAINKQIVDPYDFAAYATALVHEAIHQRGVADEGQAECQAMREVPRVVVKFFHVKPGKQLRSFMARAWVMHRDAPPMFRTVC